MALICTAGIVSRVRLRWIVSLMRKAVIRPTPEKLTAFVGSMVMASTVPRLRDDPWRPVVEQFVSGIPTFKARANEARPFMLDIAPLAATNIPVLVVVGREETLHDGPEMASRFRQRLPHARVEVVDSANHFVFIDDTARVSAELRRFLNEG